MSETLTKANLVVFLRQQNPSLTTTVAHKLVNAFFEEIIASLEQGTSVKISGLGSFRVRDKNARPGRNPKTGLSTIITPRRVVLFQASQKLKATLKKKRLK